MNFPVPEAFPVDIGVILVLLFWLVLITLVINRITAHLVKPIWTHYEWPGELMVIPVYALGIALLVLAFYFPDNMIVVIFGLATIGGASLIADIMKLFGLKMPVFGEVSSEKLDILGGEGTPGAL